MRLKQIIIALAVVGFAAAPAVAKTAKKATVKTNFVARKTLAAKRTKKKTGGTFRVSSLFSSSGGNLSPRRSGQLYSGGRYLGKAIVPFKRNLKPGTILVKTSEKALYYVLPGHKALKYGVGVGRQGFTWKGHHRIVMKKEWPEWRPPAEMIAREKKKYGRTLPEVMEGGPRNPLGARAMYIGGTLYRIHGTTRPNSIGKNVSSGCIRMLNSEVIDLYNKVKVGAPVIVE